MNALEITLTILLVCIGFYLIGIFLAPKHTRKSKEKYEPFTGGEILPVKRPKYFSQLYLIVLFFLIFDAIILIVATGNTFNLYTGSFIGLILFISLLISFEAKKL